MSGSRILDMVTNNHMLQRSMLKDDFIFLTILFGCYKLSSKTNQLLNFLNWVWSNNIVSATQFVCDVYHSHYTNMFGTMSKPVYCYQKIWPGQRFIAFPCQINYWNSIPSIKIQIWYILFDISINPFESIENQPWIKSKTECR